MYFYKTKRIGLLLVLAGCVSAGVYRKSHTLIFNPPEIQNPLASGELTQGWHAQYSSDSVQVVHHALMETLREHYNREKGMALYLSLPKPDYKISVDYKERHDHSLRITIQVYAAHSAKLQMEREIKIPANAALKNVLEKEAYMISQNLAHASTHPS